MAPGGSFVVSVMVTNAYNSSSGSCGTGAGSNYTPVWLYAYQPEVEILSVTETTTNATSGEKQTHHLGNITAAANSTTYQSYFQLFTDSQNTIQVDFEVLVPANTTQGTLLLR